MEPVDSELIGFGVKKTSEDKLTYKNIIANVINHYLFNYGYFSSRDAVKKIIQAVYFDVPGYKFRSEIDKIKSVLDDELKEMECEERAKYGRSFFKKSVQVKFKIRRSQYYWDNFFVRVIQILADHNMIIETEQVTKIRIKQDIDEGESFGSSEGSVDDSYE